MSALSVTKTMCDEVILIVWARSRKKICDWAFILRAFNLRALNLDTL